MVLSKEISEVIIYFLSVEALNTQFAILLVAYTSVVGHVGGKAVTQALIDLRDNETESIGDHVDINVACVSNAVMWNCQYRAKSKSFYEAVYLAALILLILLSIISFVLSLCRPEFWCKRKVLKAKAIIGEFLLCTAIVLLFLSFDISPLSCHIGYDSFSLLFIGECFGVDLIFSKAVINFHKAAPFFSMGCFLGWFVTNTICFIVDYKKFNTNMNETMRNMFKDEKYDSDATTENEDDDRHYEINTVIFRKIIVTTQPPELDEPRGFELQPQS